MTVVSDAALLVVSGSGVRAVTVAVVCTVPASCGQIAAARNDGWIATAAPASIRATRQVIETPSPLTPGVLAQVAPAGAEPGATAPPRISRLTPSAASGPALRSV